MKLIKAPDQLIYKTIVILISFGLITSTSFADCSYDNDTTMQEQKDECDDAAGKQWSCEQNRCLLKQGTVDIKKDYDECVKITDKADKQTCFDNVAKQEAGDTSSKLEYATYAFEYAQQAVQALSVSMAIINLAATKMPGGKGCLSQKIFMAGAVASIGSELYSFIDLDRKLSKLEEEYKEKIDDNVDEDSTNNSYQQQLDAFEYLKTEQKTIEEISRNKSIAYGIQTGLYTAASAMAIYEHTTTGLPKSCQGVASVSSSKTMGNKSYLIATRSNNKNKLDNLFHINSSKITLQNSKDSLDQFLLYSELESLINGGSKSPSLSEYNTLKESSFLANFGQESKAYFASALQSAAGLIISNAYAFDKEAKRKADYGVYAGLIGAGGIAGTAVAIAMYKGKIEPVKKALGTSTGILIMSGISAAINVSLMGISLAEMEQAKERAESIEEVIEKFKAITSDFNEQCKDDYTKPLCYCYNEDRTKNLNRTNSQTCKTQWEKDNQNAFVAGSVYAKNTKGRVGCMTLNRQFDANCDCKKLVDTNTKQNACYKTAVLPTQLQGLGVATGLPNLLATSNAMAAGNFSSGTATAGALGQQAAKTSSLNNKMLKEVNKSRIAKGQKPIKVNPSMAKSMVRSLATQDVMDATKGSIFDPSAKNLSSLGNLASKSPALKKAMSKIGTGKSKKSIKYSTSKGIKRSGSKPQNYDFSFGSAPGKKGGVQVQNYMDKKYKYKDNDIVKNEDASIWKIISNRYNTSGLRRLFED